MEKHKDPELSVLKTELETMALAELESPDSIIRTMGYSFSLNDNYSISLASRYSTGEYEDDNPFYETSIFIEKNQEVTDENQCTKIVVFSSIYEHGSQRLRGRMFTNPIDLTAELNSGEEETELLKSGLALARFIYDNNHSLDFDYGIYTLTDKLLEEPLKSIIANMIESINKLLAEGFLHERRLKTIGPENLQTYLISNTAIEPSELAVEDSLNEFELEVIFIEDGTRYSFLLNQDGTYEVRSVIADAFDRYKNYRTFKPFFDENGELLSFNINNKEIKEKEEEERRLGNYDPTIDKIRRFISRFTNFS